MNRLYLCFLVTFLACQAGDPNPTTMASKPAQHSTTRTSFLLGTYTEDKSEGIYRYAIDSDGNLQNLGLAAKAIQPSYLAYDKDRNYVLAVNEVNDLDGKGSIELFRIDQDTLVSLAKESSGGAHPCHININDSGIVLTSNYSGGNIGMHQLSSDGQLSSLLYVEDHNGNGKEAHAHSAWFYGEGNDVVSVDLGTNELWFSKVDADQNQLRAKDPATLFVKEGAGPRHLVFHPNGKWVYVINELNSTISLISATDQNGENTWTVEEHYTTLPETFTGESFCADIHLSKDGRFLYGSNRGHNSIVIYAVQADSGQLQLLGHESVRGEWPRNFALSPDDKFLIVANQHTKNLVAFQRDVASGLLKFTSEIDAPTPTCILF